MSIIETVCYRSRRHNVDYSFLTNLIDQGSSFPKGRSNNEQSLKDWVFRVENFLKQNNKPLSEIENDIRTIKFQGNVFGNVQNIVAYLRQYSENIEPPKTKTPNQIFIAMWFGDEMSIIYNDGYKTIIEELGFSSIRIDEKEHNNLIIDEICTEISNSVALIADLTNNRGGVYYEAGIARGLRLCNHQIELIFTCSKAYFYDEERKPHFDVQGNNIIIYDDVCDLQDKLRNRIKETVMKNM